MRRLYLDIKVNMVHVLSYTSSYLKAFYAKDEIGYNATQRQPNIFIPHMK